MTVNDNEGTPTVSLVLTPSSIDEDGGSTTVTATMNGQSSEEVVLTVSAAAGTGAVAADFDLSDDVTLKIAAGATASTGTVTITAKENSIDTANKSVTVSATATGGNGVAAPADQTLTLTDDDVRGVTVSKATVSMKEIDDAETDDKEHQDTYTVKLNSEPTGTVTVNVASGTASVATVDKTSLSFTTSNWSTPQVVTVTAKDDIIDNTGDERTTNITHTVVAGTSDYGGVTASPVAVTVEDEDVAPSALEITVDTDSTTGGNQTEISEGGGATTVTVTATITSATRFATAKMVTVTVGKSGDSATEGTDYGNVANVSITILKGAVSGSKDITLTPTNDTIDEPDETISVEGTLAGVTVTHAQLTLKDDDATPTVTLELGSASIGENAQTTTVKGKLSGASSQAVTLEFSALANVYTLSGTTLTIAAGSVESTGTLTITAVDNQVDAANRVVSISATVTGGNGVEAPASKTLTITDDDVRGVTISEDAVTVEEVDTDGTPEKEHQATYTVKLDSEPSTGTVTINVASDATSVATVNKASLEFTKTNWSTAQTVTVSAKDDNIDNADDERTTSITHTVNAKGTDYASEMVDSVAVTVDDNEVLPVVSLVLTSSSIGEKGGSTTVSASMNGISDKDVVLTVSAAAGAGAAAGDFTLTGTELTIESGETKSTETVTVSANDNSVDTANKSVTISATATGGNGVANPTSQTLTITDDDERGVTISESAVTIDELDNSGTIDENEHQATYTVVLDSQPTGTVTINVASSATSVATVDKASLSFTTSTWNVEQVVTITAKDDAIDNTGNKRTTNITHTISASGTDYVDETATPVAVTVDDNEGTPVVSLVLTPSSIGENGGSTTVTASMNGTSSSNVVLTVSAAAGTGAVSGDFTLTGTTLTIVAGSQISTGSVTIAAVGNSVDTANKMVTVSATATGGNGVANPANQTLTITDNDERGVTVSESSVTIEEIDDTDTEDDQEHKTTYTVVLDSQPTGTVEVLVTSDDQSVATVSPIRLTFLPAKWNEAQTVTVTAVDDNVDNKKDKRTTTIRHTTLATSTDYESETAAAVPVTVNDEDAAPSSMSITVDTNRNSSGNQNIVREIASVTTVKVTVKITDPTRFAIAKTVKISVGKLGDSAVEGTDYSEVSDFSVRIPAKKVSANKTFSLTPINDAVDEPREEISVEGELTGVTVAPAKIRLTDNESKPTVTLALSNSSINENNGSATVTATLSGASSEDVVLTVSAAAGTDTAASDFTLTGTTLTIAAGARVSTGSVTIAAVDNSVDTANKSVTVSATATGGNDVANPANQTLTITDDDERGVTISESEVTIEEVDDSGTTEMNEHQATYTVVLDSQPTGTVTINVASSAASVAMVDEASLTFTTSNWGEAQTVTITAKDDDLHNTGNKRTTNITHTISASGTDYAGETASSVAVTVNDNDDLPVVSLVLTPASIGEKGGSTTVTATTNGKSNKNVILTVSAAAGTGAAAGDFTLTGTTLTIVAGTEVSTGTVTITAVDDAVDTANKTVTVSAMASGGNGVAAPGDQTLTITDDDERGVTISESAVTIEEVDNTGTTDENEHQATYTVVLDSQPTGTVTINVASRATSVATVDKASLSFTTSTWNVEQVVTITAKDDAIDNAGNKRTTNITHTISASGTDYVDETATPVAVTVNDNDLTPLVSLALTPASIGEKGGSTTVTATMNGISDKNVVLTVSAAAGTGAVANDFTLTGTTLTITAGARVSTGTVAITAVDNAVDTANKTVTVSATATGGNGVVAPGDQTLTITDDDGRGVTISESEVTIEEVDDGTTDDNQEHKTTYTVVLDSQPTGTVTINVASRATSVATVDKASLSFTTSTWNVEQVVTITAKDDAIDNSGDKRTTNITHTISASGTDYVDETATPVAVTVNDDEGLPVVSLVLTSSSIGEKGGSTTVTATMNRISDKNVVLTVSAAASTGAVASDFTLTGTTLTIAAGARVSTGTVTITAVDNSVDTANKSVTVSATATGGNGVAAPGDRTLTITDDDERGVTISESAVTIEEVDNSKSDKNEHQATYTVVLGSQPSTGTVTVNVTSGASSVATVNKASVQFDATNWSTPQVVTITAKDDAIDNAGNKRTTNITHTVSATGNDYAGETAASVAVTVDDNEGIPVVNLVLTSSSIGEKGGSTTVTAKMNGTSSQNVVLTVGAAANTPAVARDFTLTGTTLTITAGTQVSTGTVTITAVDNAVDTANKTVTVSATASGGNGVANPANQTLTITDDDDRGVTISKSEVTIEEVDDGTTDDNQEHKTTYTVVLDSQPTGTVTINVASNATSVATVDKASLSFTTSNWNVEQVVTITAKDDAIDNTGNKRTTNITHTISASGTDYVDETATPVAVTVNDNDLTPVVSLVLTSSSIGEKGGSTTVTATMSGTSSQNVVLTVSAAAGTGAVANDFTLTGTTLTITAGARVSTGTVTITAVDNAVDTANKAVTVSATATGGNGVAAPGDRTLTITDDDERGVTISESAVTIEEVDNTGTTEKNEHQATYTVKLNSQPSTGTVTINVASGASSVATVDKTSLQFDATNWSTPQVVTITAKDDAIDNSGNKRTTNITHTVSATGNDYAGETAASVAVTVNDNDGTPQISLVLTPAGIGEKGGSTTVTATMNGTSSQNVVLTVSAAAGTGAAAGDFTLTGTTLTIVAGTQVSTGTVTITAVDNAVDTANKTVTVSATATGGNGVAAPEDQTLTITDDDGRGVTISESEFTIEEVDDGTTDDNQEHKTTYTVVLDSQPTGTVTINVASGATSVATVDKASLSFTTSTWNVEQVVTITAKDDTINNTGNKRTTNITHTISASGTDYAGETAAPVAVTVNDNDGLPVVSLVLTSSSIGEKGGSTTVTATMNGTSSQNVVLTVSAAAGTGAVANDFTVTGTTLTITAGARVSTGTVTITAVDNSVDTANKTVTVSATASGGNGVAAPGDQTLTITDDDERGVTISEDAVTIDEADVASTSTALENQAAYTVVLDSQPTGTVTVNVASSNTSVATVNKTSLTFTTSNWNVVQTVTITAKDDSIDNAGNKRATSITHTVNASGTDYVDETATSVAVTVNDDDGTPVVSLALTSSSIGEKGGSTTVIATMTGTASTDVVLTVSAAAGTGAVAGDFNLTGTTLTITAGAQVSTGSVTITAVDNAVDSANKSVTVSATATGGNGVANPTDRTLTITDDDERGVTVSESSVTIEEVDDATTNSEQEHKAIYTVVLNSQPTGTVTVNVASGATSVATVDKASLSFTTSNWNVEQTVTITAKDDAIDNTGNKRTTSITNTISASGTDYADETATSVAVTVNDDDGTLSISIDNPKVVEGNGSSTSLLFTIRLSSSSGQQVAVNYKDTKSGTAAVGKDYESIKSGTVNFFAGRINQDCFSGRCGRSCR